MRPRLITLTTDFGYKDAYVAAMKAAIFRVAGTAARVLDITHEIEPHDVMEAAFVLRPTIPYLPDDSINVVVVDPGVGSSRAGVAIRFRDRIYVGPDNGVLPLILGTDEPDEIVELNAPAYWLSESPSATFHGRDIFAPVAAHIAMGVPLSEVGSVMERLEPLHWALPITDEEGIRGWVVHVDRFGNCITNIERQALADQTTQENVKLYVGNARLEGIKRTYSDVANGEPVALVGSNGFVEIAVNGGNAATLLGIEKGAPVNLLFGSDSRETDVRAGHLGTEFAHRLHRTS